MKIIIVLASLLFTLISANPAAGDFKIVKQDKVVSLYERWVPVNEKDKVRELKALFEVRSTPSQLISLLQNQQQGPKWNLHAKDYKINPGSQPNQWFNYIKYSMPWPFDDQDCSLLFSIDNASQVSFSSINTGLYPIRKNISRIDMVKGRWYMQEKSPGVLQITYLISTAKSKKVPTWISDPIIHKNMVETIKAFKKTLENG